MVIFCNLNLLLFPRFDLALLGYAIFIWKSALHAYTIHGAILAAN